MKNLAVLILSTVLLSGCVQMFEQQTQRFRDRCTAYGIDPQSAAHGLCVQEENNRFMDRVRRDAER